MLNNLNEFVYIKLKLIEKTGISKQGLTQRS
jgi:hypothetical protein